MFQLAILLLSVPLQLGLVYFSSGIEEKVYEYVDYVNSVIKQVEFWNTLMNWMKYSGRLFREMRCFFLFLFLRT